MEIGHPSVVGVDQNKDRGVEHKSEGEPDRPAFCQFAVLREYPGLEAYGADADANKEVPGIKQDTAGLDRKPEAAQFQPAWGAAGEMHPHIDPDRDSHTSHEAHHPPRAPGKDTLP